MCIVLISTAHPDYALIIISNRDEFLERPTAPAAWWAPPNEHVLGGRDLHRPVQGTWLGVTKDGRVAALTNYREESSKSRGLVSRGAMVNAFLNQPSEEATSTNDFVRRLIADEGAKGAGGFSLVCGRIGEPLAIISNRTHDVDAVTWIASRRGETVGLSNAAFSDHSWPKVLQGEKLMDQAIAKAVDRHLSKDTLIESLMDVLSTDTLPRYRVGDDWETYINQLRNSIYIPMIGGKGTTVHKGEDLASAKSRQPVQFDPETAAVYGTQMQSVVLVDHEGQVTFVQRSIYDSDLEGSQTGPNDQRFEYTIDRASGS